MLETGQQFAHFTIEKKLGEGGMGAVYLAEDRKLNRRVALKVLLPEFFDNSEHQQRFRREAKTAAQLSHPNIMAIHTIDAAPDPQTGEELGYIVMEYVEGLSLTEYIATRKPDTSAMLVLAEKIASGLAAAHKQSIVHRDIKPENILINADNEPKILDFGLARVTAPLAGGGEDNATETISRELTRAGKILGTVSYMSPEQARGETIDPRSDIFSFGIVLYLLATGELPFAGGSQVSTLAKILEVPHEPPRLKNDAVPPELERIIDKCLRKKPDDRYQDTRDLVVDLRSLRRQFDSGITEGVSAIIDRPSTAKKTYELKIGWKSLSVIAVAAVVLLLVILEFAGNPEYGGVSQLEAKGNSLAIIGFENKTGDPELDWLETGLPEILLTDLAQSQVFKLISRERIIDCFPAHKRTNHTFQECVDAAATLGATSILSGSFYKLGNKIRIDARLQDVATGNIQAGLKVVGTDPFTLVDSLTNKVARALNIEQGEQPEVDVANYTSSSPEAFKHYRAGMDLMNAQRFDEAIEEFQHAVTFDSTFALPYMRIGMSYVFDGRLQEGAKYFAQALEHEAKLPIRDRHLLDVYADTWLKREFDNAFTKLESFVSRYSDDKEGHTIFALFLHELKNDTTRAFEHLDKALALDPAYQLALSAYATAYERRGNIDKAIEWTEKILQLHPESPQPYLELGGFYAAQMRYDEAIAKYHALLAQTPEHPQALLKLSQLHIFKRDFGQVLVYLERLKKYHGDDPFLMRSCFTQRANLAAWQGNFNAALGFRLNAWEEALKTEDSIQIFSSLSSIVGHFQDVGEIDSALIYLKQTRSWAPTLARVNYPLDVVMLDRGMAEKVRPEMKEAVKEFRSRTPSESWGIIDAVEDLFEAYATVDTAAMITAWDLLVTGERQSGAGNTLSLGKLMALYGQHTQARDHLLKIIEGDSQTILATKYLSALYYLGIAEEGLENPDRAADYYTQMLEYWGNADTVTWEIQDARDRLTRLTS